METAWILFVFALFGGMIGIGLIALKRATIRTVAPPIRKAHQAVTDWDKARQERYNNLPDLGKARVDKRSAQIAKYGGTAAMGLGATIVFAVAGVTGGWIIPLALGSRWVAKNWKDQSNAIKDADERRDEILR
jgi:hypothetical protein